MLALPLGWCLFGSSGTNSFLWTTFLFQRRASFPLEEFNLVKEKFNFWSETHKHTKLQVNLGKEIRPPWTHINTPHVTSFGGIIITHLFLEVQLLKNCKSFWHVRGERSLLIGPNSVLEQPLTSVGFLEFGIGLIWVDLRFWICFGDRILWQGGQTFLGTLTLVYYRYAIRVSTNFNFDFDRIWRTVLGLFWLHLTSIQGHIYWQLIELFWRSIDRWHWPFGTVVDFDHNFKFG